MHTTPGNNNEDKLKDFDTRYKVLPPLTGVGDLVKTDEENTYSEALPGSKNSNDDDLNLNLEDELISQFPINWIIGSLLLAVLSVILFMSIKISRGS